MIKKLSVKTRINEYDTVYLGKEVVMDKIAGQLQREIAKGVANDIVFEQYDSMSPEIFGTEYIYEATAYIVDKEAIGIALIIQKMIDERVITFEKIAHPDMMQTVVKWNEPLQVKSYFKRGRDKLE